MRTVLVFSCLCLGLPALAADSASTLSRARTRAGVWAGLGVVTGKLELRSQTAALGTRVDAVPAVALGLDYWDSDRLGAYLAATIGTGAKLDLPEGQKLAYNVFSVEAGGRLRWHFGPRANALAVFLGAGLQVIHQDTQEQRPILFVDTTTGGPALTLGLEWPILGERLWLRASGRVGLPLFVREQPADSGDPQDFLTLGARAELVSQLSGPWGAALAADYTDNEVSFAGQGTRASGVLASETRDRFTTYYLVGRYAL